MLASPIAPHPFAFAALPWQLVLAFIVFNIVAGMISKRKQKPSKPDSKANPRAEARKADARRDQGDSRNGEIQRSLEETRLREAAEAKQKAASREARQAREEVLRARDEARSSGAPEPEGRPAETTAAPVRTRVETPPAAGRGLLDQLARELGLELPKPTGKAPAPSAPSRSPAKPAPVQAPRPPERQEGSTTPTSVMPPLQPPQAQPLPGALDLSDPEAMRKAFILKVILDKPVALKHR